MAWVPNGAGAGSNNSSVGGGGGFMAYPQPPTGPEAAFQPPEDNGQFGGITITFNNTIGTFFTIVNPGRSTNS